ncbi:SapB/AmfS family lanthipeptide [Herbidospora galbida]
MAFVLDLQAREVSKEPAQLMGPSSLSPSFCISGLTLFLC